MIRLSKDDLITLYDGFTLRKMANGKMIEIQLELSARELYERLKKVGKKST